MSTARVLGSTGEHPSSCEYPEYLWLKGESAIRSSHQSALAPKSPSGVQLADQPDFVAGTADLGDELRSLSKQLGSVLTAPVCAGTGLTPPPATSAPELGSSLPHLHEDSARPSHI